MWNENIIALGLLFQVTVRAFHQIPKSDWKLLKRGRSQNWVSSNVKTSVWLSLVFYYQSDQAFATIPPHTVQEALSRWNVLAQKLWCHGLEGIRDLVQQKKFQNPPHRRLAENQNFWFMTYACKLQKILLKMKFLKLSGVQIIFLQDFPKSNGFLGKWCKRAWFQLFWVLLEELPFDKF